MSPSPAAGRVYRSCDHNSIVSEWNMGDQAIGTAATQRKAGDETVLRTHLGPRPAEPRPELQAAEPR